MPIWASPWHMQTPGPASAPQTLQIVQHEKLPSLALLPHLLLTQSDLAIGLFPKKPTRIALVSNAIVIASCMHLHFADLPEKLKCLFSPTIINALDLPMHLKLHK
jgi:hypothetical protein